MVNAGGNANSAASAPISSLDGSLAKSEKGDSGSFNVGGFVGSGLGFSTMEMMSSRPLAQQDPEVRIKPATRQTAAVEEKEIGRAGWGRRLGELPRKRTRARPSTHPGRDYACAAPKVAVSR